MTLNITSGDERRWTFGGGKINGVVRSKCRGDNEEEELVTEDRG